MVSFTITLKWPYWIKKVYYQNVKIKFLGLPPEESFVS